MRWPSPLAIALALALTFAAAACRQTIVLDSADGGGGSGGGFGGFGGGFGGFGGTFDGGQLPDCTGLPIKLTAELPDVMVVLDRSTGMDNERFGSSNASPLSSARDALDFYASKYQKVVRFGYVEFPGASQSCNSQTGCCASMASLPSSNFQAFEVALHTCDQDPPYCVISDQRSTAAALASAAMSFSRDGNTHAVLLITNGQPDCGSTGQSTPCMDATTIVNQLNQVGVSTQVVVPEAGQLDDPTKSCLQGIALQGAMPGAMNVAPYYHLASTPAQLTDMINQFTHAAAKYACHLDQQTSSPMQIKPDSVLSWRNPQTGNMQVVQNDRNDGWSSGNGYTIDLNGSWCEALIDGDPQKDFMLLTGCDQRPH